MTTITPLSGIDSLTGATGLSGTTATTGTSSTSGTSFSSVLGNAVDSLQGLADTANSTAISAVTGDLTDIHQATLAATRYQVTMQVVSAVRNSGVDAFSSIMNMQA